MAKNRLIMPIETVLSSRILQRPVMIIMHFSIFNYTQIEGNWKKRNMRFPLHGLYLSRTQQPSSFIFNQIN